MRLGLGLGFNGQHIIGGDSTQSLNNIVSGALAEYDATNDECVPSATQFNSRLPNPADGSSTADWNTVVAEDVLGEAPTLTGSGSSRGWLSSSINGSTSAEGDGYFEGQVNGASLPPFLRDLHKGGSFKMSWMMDFHYVGTHGPRAVISTKGTSGETGFHIVQMRNATANNQDNRIFISNASGTDIIFSSLRTGRHVNAARNQMYMEYEYDSVAGSLRAAYYDSTNTLIEQRIQNSLPNGGAAHSANPTGTFYLWWNLDDKNAPPPGSVLYKLYLFNDIYNADDRAALFAYMNGA